MTKGGNHLIAIFQKMLVITASLECVFRAKTAPRKCKNDFNFVLLPQQVAKIKDGCGPSKTTSCPQGNEPH